MHLHGNVQSAQYFQDLIKQLLEANGKQSGRFYLAKIMLLPYNYVFSYVSTVSKIVRTYGRCTNLL